MSKAKRKHKMKNAHLISRSQSNQKMSKSLAHVGPEQLLIVGSIIMNADDSEPRLNKVRDPKIELHQLRHAVAAADLGSFRQAAEVSLIKQSTLSRSVQQLEHTVGVRLFERSSNGVRATPAGRAFLKGSRSILEQIDSLLKATRENKRGNAGCLTIGFCTSLMGGNLRASLLDFRLRHPQVALTVFERSHARLAIALRNGVVDLLIIAGSVSLLESSVMPLWSERILVALPEDHPLAQREILYWTDLRNETVLLSQYDPGREMEDLLVSKLTSSDYRPRIERHEVSRKVIESLVGMKAGVGLVLESDVGANFSGVVYRELRDGTGASCLRYVAYWRADNENPAVAAFVNLLSERYPSTCFAR